MLKFNLENMTKVENPEYLPVGSVIDVKTNFDDSELIAVEKVLSFLYYGYNLY